MAEKVELTVGVPYSAYATREKAEAIRALTEADEYTADSVRDAVAAEDMSLLIVKPSPLAAHATKMMG